MRAGCHPLGLRSASRLSEIFGTSYFGASAPRWLQFTTDGGPCAQPPMGPPLVFTSAMTLGRGGAVPFGQVLAGRSRLPPSPGC